jgi:hypothetical protein
MYVVNQSNKVHNKSIKQSTEYKSITDGKDLQQKEYDRIKKEIDDLQASKLRRETEGASAINSLPSNYITKRGQLSSALNQDISKIQDSINQKSTELSGVANELKVPIDTSNLKVNEDRGFASTFSILADGINSITEEEVKQWAGVVYDQVGKDEFEFGVTLAPDSQHALREVTGNNTDAG